MQSPTRSLKVTVHGPQVLPFCVAWLLGLKHETELLQQVSPWDMLFRRFTAQTFPNN